MLRLLRIVSGWMMLVWALGVQAQLPLYDLPDPITYPVQTSATAAITRGGRVIVSSPLAGRVSIINLEGTLDAELDIGADPQGVAIVPDNLRVLAVSRAAGNLAVIDLETNQIGALYALGDQPYAVVASEETAYISLQATDEIAVVRLADGRIMQRIPTPPDPAGLALWGDFLYVTHFWSGEFSLIYLPAAQVVRTISTAPQASLSSGIEIDPVAARAYLPQTLANTTAGAGLANRHIPVVQVIDLHTMQVQRTINLVVADRPLSMPFAVRLPANRARLYVASAGSDAVTVINLDSDTADTHFETGSSPRAILFNRDSSRVYVQDALSGTITVRDTRFFGLEDQIPTYTTPVAPALQIGARLFFNAADSRLSRSGLTACASCHFDRTGDGRVWNDTPTPPLSAPDTLTAAWLAAHLETMQGGSGLPENSLDLDGLLEYLRH